MIDDEETPFSHASPPCFASELDPEYADRGAAKPQNVEAVRDWRRAERSRLLAARAALPVAMRQLSAQQIAQHLDQILLARPGALAGLTVSAWWPIKAELDLRFWLATLGARGARAALPVVVARAAPLTFRAWTPGADMERGFWNIPVPASGPEIVPDILLSPVVGWDAEGYRLGYGGGYFDRTLAALTSRPLAIGIGLASARIDTIFPQPHDIAMHIVITEDGIHRPSVRT